MRREPVLKPGRQSFLLRGWRVSGEAARAAKARKIAAARALKTEEAEDLQTYREVRAYVEKSILDALTAGVRVTYDNAAQVVAVSGIPRPTEMVTITGVINK